MAVQRLLRQLLDLHLEVEHHPQPLLQHRRACPLVAAATRRMPASFASTPSPRSRYVSASSATAMGSPPALHSNALSNIPAASSSRPSDRCDMAEVGRECMSAISPSALAKARPCVPGDDA